MDGEITPDEVRDLVDGDGDACIVDIRDERSFERGHIPGSRNLPFHELASRIDELEGEDRVVTVCPHGKASVQAARLVSSYEGTADARVESMAGGLEAYATEYDLVGGGGSSADVDRDEPATSPGEGEPATADGEDEPAAGGDESTANGPASDADAPF